MDNFRNIDDIPPPYRNIFTEYPCFNAVQSKVLDDILYTDNSVVVSAPTGSGKTAIFELAIIRLLMQYENIDMSQKIKIVYICPMKALCQERLVDWHTKFSSFGLNCVAITGDSDNIEFQHLTNHDLIISTPEKWDSLTRRWRDNEKIVKVVKLFMIDEVHLLNEENRGSTLEVIVCRMKTVENCKACSVDENNIFNQKIRFIALSATVPNVEDIAKWIGNPPNTKYYRFSEEMRPVKLKKIVYGYSFNMKTSPFKFDISLNYKLPSLVMQYSDGKPTLIFCSTRKSVEMTANHIVKSLKIHLNQEQIQKLLDVANMISDSKAKATVKHGVGYHHAGMIPETRHAIENLFRKGDLPVLVTTSTLAMGVNLPAHLVIVKSTKCYDNGGFRDYTETAIHQMIGRAGRPQFDTSATALILTSNDDKHKFEKMVGCGQPIESNLHRHLTEHLNAEIVLRTITDLDVAMQWLSSTFLYVRARKNPHHYGINVGFTEEQIDKKLLEICQIDLNKLVKSGMITIDENIIITPNATGKIMAKYYIAFETMKLFTQISGSEILIQILALISKCQEFAPMRLRVNDKKTLNLLNKNSQKNTIRFPLNGKIKTWDMKVNCIIQAVLGNLDISDHSILSESLTIMRNGERIAKCLIEYLETRGTNCYSALLNSIILAKCFRAKLWENSPYVSKQLNGIGSVMSNQLVNAGKTTFKKIVVSNPRDIELIIKRKPPMGNALIEEVEHLPHYNMTLEKTDKGKQLKICIVLENCDDLREKSTINTHSVMTLLVGNSLNEVLIYEKYEHSYMMENTEVTKFVAANSEEINAHFISEDWVGIDCNSTMDFNITKSQGTKAVKEKSPDKKSPTYIQMFLDMYMKTKKKATVVPAKNEALIKNAAKPTSVHKGKPKNFKKTKTQTPVVDVEKELNTEIIQDHGERSDKNNLKENDNSQNLESSISDLNESYSKNDDFMDKTKAQEDILEDVIDFETSPFSQEILVNCNDSEGSKKITVGRFEKEKISDDGLYEDVEEKKVNDKNVEEKDDCEKSSNLINIDERVIKAPSLFSISQKYDVESRTKSNQSEKLCGKRKRKVDDSKHPMDFENSLYKEEDKKRQRLAEFKYPTKKKFSHNPMLPESNQRYTITEILEPSKKHREVFYQVESESDMENSVKEKSKENMQKSITWRSPLVFSPAVKFSPKVFYQNISVSRDNTEMGAQNETNDETFETSISSKSNINSATNLDKTPNQKQNRVNLRFANKNRGTLFPLTDKECNGTSNNERQIDDAFDICSNSFLENLGYSNNQYKNTPKSKKMQSPTINYYSQLLSQPLYVQKTKTHETPKSEKNNSKNNEISDETEKENCGKNALKEKYVEEFVPKSDIQHLSQMRYNNYSPQMFPNRQETGNLRGNHLEKFDKHVPDAFISTRNRPTLYDNMEYIPHDLNRSYMSNTNFVQSRPMQYTMEDQNRYMRMQQNYENQCNPYSSLHRPPDYVQNSDAGAKLVRHNYSSTKPYRGSQYGVPHTYFDYPNSQINQSMRGSTSQNFEDVPPSIDRNFNGANSSHLGAIGLNCSRYFDNDWHDEYNQQKQYSQYFRRNCTGMDNFHSTSSIPKVENKREILQNSRHFKNSESDNISHDDPQQYPEMLSFQDLSQQNDFTHNKSIEAVSSQSPNLIQQKRFEQYMNEENVLRNMRSSVSESAVKREDTNTFEPKYRDPHYHCSGRIQERPSWVYQQEYDREPNTTLMNMYNYSDIRNQRNPGMSLNNLENTLNNNISKKLDRTLSFGEKSGENMRLAYNPRLPEQIYGAQRNDLNCSFSARNTSFPQNWDIGDQDLRFQNNFGQQQAVSNFSRSFNVPTRVCHPDQNYYVFHHNSQNENIPLVNDKAYVMSKFLFSLDEQ